MWDGPCSRGATPRDHRILPKRIILVRHAESEGNVDNFAYCYVPDPQVPLVRLCTTVRATLRTARHVIVHPRTTCSCCMHLRLSRAYRAGAAGDPALRALHMRPLQRLDKTGALCM